MKAILSFVFWAAVGFGAFHMLNYVHDATRQPTASRERESINERVQQAGPVATPGEEILGK